MLHVMRKPEGNTYVNMEMLACPQETRESTAYKTDLSLIILCSQNMSRFSFPDLLSGNIGLYLSFVIRCAALHPLDIKENPFNYWMH